MNNHQRSDSLEPWSSVWFGALQNGDEIAIERLWNQYFSRMLTIAKRRLQGADLAARDEEDIALSAFNSFCIGLREGKFQKFSDSVGLWPLMVALTLNKATDQIRSNNRLKRGGSAGASGSAVPLANAYHLSEIESSELSPDVALAASDAVEHLLRVLNATGDSELLTIAVASMEGNSQAEIASQLNCTVRTIQRKLKTIRGLWEQILE